jgi:hypothetical protein
MENPPDVVRLSFTDHDLQSVAQRDHPTLAAESINFPDVSYVDDCIAVNSLEWLPSKTLFDHPQGLSGQELLFGGDDPYQLSLGLKTEYFVRVQQNVFRAGPSDYFAAGRGIRWRAGGSDGGDSIGFLERFLPQPPRAFDGLVKPRFTDGFEQVVNGTRFERFDGMFVESGHNHYYWNISTAKLTDYLKAAHDRHLKVEENQIRMELRDHPQGICAVFRFPNDLYAGHAFQFFPQDAPRDLLVVDDQSLEEGSPHFVSFYTTSLV